MSAGAEILNWIDDLPEDVRAAVLAEMKTVKAPAKTLIYERNAPVKGLYRIVRGEVRVFTLTPEGRELVFKIYGAPENFGDISAIDGAHYPVFAETVGECELRFLSREQLCRLRATHHAVESALVRFLVKITRSSLGFMEDAAVSSLQARVASRLGFLYASAKARGENPAELKIAQKDIGVMIGASRQATNKALAELQAQGLIETSYGAVRILDPGRLRAVSRPYAAEAAE
ncbi:MAG: Crp/Fnr family transcriptional regulator [Parvularculaceae bacterium]